MSPAGFEHLIPTNEQPQINALDPAATGIVFQTLTLLNCMKRTVARSRVTYEATVVMDNNI
jgi:hypothetical protein